MLYAEYDAAIAAGATLDELYKLERGLYPVAFRAKLIAWHNLSITIKNHQEAAAIKAAKKK